MHGSQRMGPIEYREHNGLFLRISGGKMHAKSVANAIKANENCGYDQCHTRHTFRLAHLHSLWHANGVCDSLQGIRHYKFVFGRKYICIIHSNISSERYFILYCMSWWNELSGWWNNLQTHSHQQTSQITLFFHRPHRVRSLTAENTKVIGSCVICQLCAKHTKTWQKRCLFVFHGLRPYRLRFFGRAQKKRSQNESRCIQRT